MERWITLLTPLFAKFGELSAQGLVSAIGCMAIDDIYDRIIQAGAGCPIVKRDIKDSFRIVPVSEDNQHLLAFQWKDSTYIECCLPFGLSTAPFLFDLFAEALHWVLQCLLPAFHINHYLYYFIAITQSRLMCQPVGLFRSTTESPTTYVCHATPQRTIKGFVLRFEASR